MLSSLASSASDWLISSDAERIEGVTLLLGLTYKDHAGVHKLIFANYICDSSHGLTKITRIIMNWFKVVCSGWQCKHSTNS